MTHRRLATALSCSALALALMSVCPSLTIAQEGHSHATQEAEAAQDAQSSASTLLKIVRDSTDKYQNVNIAKAQGYSLMFGCVTGSDSGAMGLHFVNGTILSAGILDPTRPTIIIYEPMPDGTLKLIGADFVVFADAWNK